MSGERFPFVPNPDGPEPERPVPNSVIRELCDALDADHERMRARNHRRYGGINDIMRWLHLR